MNKRAGIRQAGFTLLELVVVITIIALATAMVSLSLRDADQTQLEREALRLSALLESARAQSRASGNPVRWQPTATGFLFTGLPNQAEQRWLDPQTQVRSAAPLLLGPEPIIAAQDVVLFHANAPDQTLWVGTDGLHPFTVRSGNPQGGAS